MAIKQRALMKLDMTKKHVLHVMRTWNKAALGEVYRDLTEARDLYREGLPRSGYAAYGEIYDGLILAVQKVMEGGEADFQEEVLALCQELLEHLERETAKETRFKKEIFFLPYKLSMFDSLESVWRAADEDKEHCNAYVMPIPYADRNPDQTVAAWHCERDQFPKDVPTLDWQQVDLKVWHPDIVVYHSPYDDCNTVTSVDEQYYSRNLRYCAEKLVYIPYFVLDEIEPGDEGAEEGIAHFILAPGVLNADLIVVQSEKMRQVYINVLSRYTNQGEEYWQAHVSGAGSPKIEKVLTSKKEDFEMPEKWRQLVEGKKVILYNTSIAAMLQHSDKVCDKLRYVFDVFRNRDDVVLWWRPHPLMKATFHSMRPQFEEEYLGLEKQYIEEGWGIYDDSSDLHRAICWSDGYYGDGSSLIILYQMKSRPVLLQNFDVGTKKSNRYDLEFVSCVFLHHRIFFLPINLDGIYSYDINTHCVALEAKIPFHDVETSEKRSFELIHIHGSKLYLVPLRGNAIASYDLCTHQWKLHLFDDIETNLATMTFKYVYEINNVLWMLPLTTNTIVSFDLKTNKFCYYRDWYQKFMLHEVFSLQMIFFVPIVIGECILATSTRSNRVLFLDTKKSIIEISSIGDDSGNTYKLATDGDRIWVCNQNGEIYLWKNQNELVFLAAIRNEDLSDSFNMLYVDGYLWLFINFADRFYRIDILTGTIDLYSGFLPEVKEEWIGYTSLKYDHGRIYILPNGGNSLVEYDLNTDMTRVVNISIDREEYRKAHKDDGREQKKATTEYFQEDIDDFIRSIHKENGFNDKVADTGSEIYDEIVFMEG